MITINLTDIYLCLLKLSATIFLISGVIVCFLTFAYVNIDIDESKLGFFAYIVTAAWEASFAMLIILLLVLVIFYIWKI